MIFQKDHLYHIYNRSIGGRRVFINYENYIYFLRKIRKHLLEHCNVIAYCLMPDHFHMLVYVTAPEISLATDTFRNKPRSLNTSIGIILRSYTQALQKQEKFNGSLFQQHTKAVCLTDPEGIDPAYFNTAFGIKINVTPLEKEYPQVCFDYIHNNPVKAGLVNTPDQWKFSSAIDYAGKRKGILIDKDRASQFGSRYT